MIINGSSLPGLAGVGFDAVNTRLPRAAPARGPPVIDLVEGVAVVEGTVASWLGLARGAGSLRMRAGTSALGNRSAISHCLSASLSTRRDSSVRSASYFSTEVR